MGLIVRTTRPIAYCAMINSVARPTANCRGCGGELHANSALTVRRSLKAQGWKIGI